MPKALLIFLLLLSPAMAVRAEEAALEDQDVYYAPDVAEDAPNGATPTPAVALPQGAYLSRARIVAFDFSGGQELAKAELFLGHDFLGLSPLSLQGRVVAPGAELAARLDGYDEALRPSLRLPAEGEVRVALLSENAASWYTTPAWVVGLGLLAASVGAYQSENTAPGLMLVGGGVGVIALSQLAARFFHLPSLRRQVQDYNARPEAVPAP